MAGIHELYAEMLNMREKSEMQSHLSAHTCKLEQTSPSRTLESEPENMLSIQHLQVKVPHGSFRAKWRRQTGQHPQVYSLHPEFQGSLAQVLKLKNIVVLIHAVYLQLNGEVIVIENQEKKNVNCSVMYLQTKKRIPWDCQKNVRSTRMSCTMHHVQASTAVRRSR